MIKRIALWGALCLLGISFKAEAQNYAIGTNLPYWLTGTINLQPSMALTQKVTLELGIQAKPIDFKLPLPTGLMDTFYSDRSLGADERFKIHNVYHTQHAFIQPGIRYWAQGAYNRSFFIGLNLIAGYYKFGTYTGDTTYSKGYLFGGGMSLGYAYELSPHWNIEGELGGSFVQALYDRYHPNGTLEAADQQRSLLLPTRVSLSLVYIL